MVGLVCGWASIACGQATWQQRLLHAAQLLPLQRRHCCPFPLLFRWKPQRLVGARSHYAAPKRAVLGAREGDTTVAAQAKVGSGEGRSALECALLAAQQ